MPTTLLCSDRLNPVQIEQNKSLKSLNTLGFECHAQLYTEAGSKEDLEAAAQFAREHKTPVFILGGGSNLVLTNDIPGLTIRLTNDTVTFHQDDLSDQTIVVAGAGMNWHECVKKTAERSLSGIENLSLIPGTVGAAPVQNIGAYGVELKVCFSALQSLHLTSGQWLDFTKDDCSFAYRDSFFKSNPGEYAIFSVTLSLSREANFNISYHALASELNAQNLPLTPMLISKTVSSIRRSKLPDPGKLGNAGSFFKNPVISVEQHAALKQTYPNIISFEQADGSVKIAAGWLIDSLGYKGLSKNGVGVYEKQALVLVNHGEGTADALMKLARQIKADVSARYGIVLEIEPQII